MMLHTLLRSEDYKGEGSDVRVLIHKATNIVDFVMHNHEQVLLGGMLGNIGEGEFLGHRGGSDFNSILVS